MPFLTEELWEGMGYNHTDVRIMRAPWPSSGLDVALEADTVAYVEAKHDLIRVGRILRKEYGLALKQTTPFSVRVDDVHIQERIEADKASIIAALKADSLEIGMNIEPSGATPSGISALGTVYMSIEGLVDIEAELAKLNAELEIILGHLKGVQGKLQNKSFVDKAPEAVVQVQRDKEVELLEKRDKLTEMIATLSNK